MYFHLQQLINEIEPDEPDPAAANALGTTISRLLDGSPAYQGKKTDPVDAPGAGGAIPLNIALDHGNIHHYGADAGLIALIEATAAMEMADIDATFGKL